ncbi:uncharacterized protein KY384_003400 [Bacidia gigantensis]|uniref:uncharacterized protein n=1 Tax=Bacidia gigantensis TaxID=2732470 RepID=UPI001D04F2FC|nr:uncharacterized protein KY384_003400 [Bacidia gigantensis]KAG8531764.1 hypothetical protein KY384_003400 [Bacidia gigantensis]
MDPVSFAASLLTLLAAANHVAKGLDKLASIRGAPLAVLALNNEVSDLRLVLCEAEPLLEKHKGATISSAIENQSLLSSIERAKDRLMELESIIGNRLMRRMGTKDKLGWLYEQDKVQKALLDVQKAKSNVTTMLGIVTTSASFRVEAQLKDVQDATQQSQIASQSLLSQNESLESKFIQMIEAQQQFHERFHERLHRVEESLLGNSKLVGRSSVKEIDAPNQEFARPSLPRNSSGSMFTGNSFSALRMRFLRQSKCEQWCNCKCHMYKRTRAPQYIESILGALFFGYTGLPTTIPECSNIRCRRSSEVFLQVNYYFPYWFLARALSMAMKIQRSTIPQFKLRILNLRDSYDEIFQNAISGDSHSIQYLLASGQASVRDISDDSGHTPLHIAVRDSRVEVIRVLLQHGAEPFLENRQQETPYDTASDNIFYFQGTPNASTWRVDEMRELFPITEWVEERRQFTHMHKIVLQILALDLGKALRKDRSSIDKGDADGRTPLSWAAARGDSKSVELLLRNGASPNNPDRIGQRPLRQSLKASDAKCLQLLLHYGATVDQTDDWKQTCLLAAHYYPDPVSFTTLLLKAGAQVNTRCSQGRFPLMEAVSKNNVAAVRLLLDHGADVNYANNAGATALHEGVRHNSHEALLLFLDAAVDHTLRDAKGRTVLHYAAQYADLKTLNILHREQLFGLNADDPDVDKLDPITIAENRKVKEEARGVNIVNLEWITRFTDLLESLLTFKTPKSVPSYSGSVESEDIFLEAVQHLNVGRLEKIADLTEHGQLPYKLNSTIHSQLSPEPV